ncbi:MAG: general stress protein CsbD [Flavobacteriales bacterium]|nr:general stress protein CsbD [Flavobacteriales bacterium]|tara:strand:- start:25 stop:219 length:195 start_codon:yes stop_codon:yes gene_type:complete
MINAIEEQIKGNWNQIKGKLKEEYAELSEDDLVFEEGKTDQLIGKIQEKTGKTKLEIQEFIDEI